MNRIARRYSSDPIFCALLVGVLMLRALVPAGFMPGSGAGLLTVQLCTLQGLKTVKVPAPGEKSPAPPFASDSLCPFGASTSSAPVPEDSSAMVLRRPHAAVALPLDSGFHPSAILRTQSARAPPALV